MKNKITRKNLMDITSIIFITLIALLIQISDNKSSSFTEEIIIRQNEITAELLDRGEILQVIHKISEWEENATTSPEKINYRENLLSEMSKYNTSTTNITSLESDLVAHRLEKPTFLWIDAKKFKNLMYVTEFIAICLIILLQSWAIGKSDNNTN